MWEFLRKLFSGRGKKAFAYSPRFGRSRKVRQFRIGDFDAELLTDIESTGAVEYTHILAVYDSSGAPVLFTAAEVNSMSIRSGPGSHFLGMFDGSGHATIEAECDLADLETFAAESLKILSEQFNIK